MSPDPFLNIKRETHSEQEGGHVLQVGSGYNEICRKCENVLLPGVRTIGGSVFSNRELTQNKQQKNPRMAKNQTMDCSEWSSGSVVNIS